MKSLRLLSVIIALIGAFGISSALTYNYQAKSPYDNKTYYYNISDNGVFIVAPKSGTKYTGVLQPPTEISYNGNTLHVAGIDDYAFANQTGITGIYLPGMMSYLGQGVFKGCTSLETINLSGYSNITYLQAEVFMGCTSLNFSASELSNITSIGESAFEGCTSLWAEESQSPTFSLPSRVSGIVTAAFKDCTSIRYINIPGISSVAMNLFKGCTSLEKFINNNVNSIGWGAFSGCTSLQQVIAGGSTPLGFIADDAFDGCDGLYDVTLVGNNNLEIPARLFKDHALQSVSLSKIASIGTEAFAGCCYLNTLTITNSPYLTSIGDYAFKGTHLNTSGDGPLDLTQVTYLGEGAFMEVAETPCFEVDLNPALTEIKPYTFAESMLTGCTIPANVKTIGERAFYRCSSVEDFGTNFEGCEIGKEAFMDCDFFGYSDKYSNDLNAVSIGERAFCNTYIGKIFVDAVVIGDEAFKNCVNLNYFYSNEVERLGSRVFDGCTSLASITLGNLSVLANDAFASEDPIPVTNLQLDGPISSISPSAFQAFKNTLQRVDLPLGLAKVPEDAFNDFMQLGYVYFNTNVERGCLTEIGARAFNNCVNLNLSELPEGIVSIGDHAFYSCLDIDDFEFPKSLRRIGAYAFAYSGLSAIDLPEGVETIGEYAFYRTKPGSIKLPSTLYQLGKYAFSDIILTDDIDVEIPEAITEIPEGLFCNAGTDQIEPGYNYQLRYVYFPNTVKHIGARAFQNCEYLILKLPNRLESIGAYAFENITRCDRTITLPKSLKSIGDYAFSGMCKNNNYAYFVILNPDPSAISLGTGVFDYAGERETWRTSISVPDKGYEAYISHPSWQTYKYNVDGVDVDVEFSIYAFVPESYDLTDAQPYNWDSSSSMVDDYCDVVYTRNFLNTAWQPLYLPFNMSYTEWCDYASVAQLTGVHVYDDNNDGVSERTVIEFQTVTAGEIVPNVPYIIKAKSEGRVEFECEGKTLVTPNSGNGSIQCSSTKWNYTFYGTYQPIDVDPEEYVMSGGRLVHAASTLSPYRFYLVVSRKGGGYWGKPGQNELPNEIYINVDGEICGIADVVFDESDEDISGEYFDLLGRKVENPSNGIFIHDGRKVYIK